MLVLSKEKGFVLDYLNDLALKWEPIMNPTNAPDAVLLSHQLEFQVNGLVGSSKNVGQWCHFTTTPWP